MNWKKESENELREYGEKKEALQNIPILIKGINCELSLLKMKDRSDNRCVDLFMENIIKKNELGRNLILIKQRVDLIENGLNGISDEDRMLLDYFYIHRPDGHVLKLCEKLGYEKSSIYGRKDKALRRFVLAMYDLQI